MKNSLVKRVIQDQKGSLLIGLIVVMTIFASMGAAMMSVTTTSTLSQIWTGASSQAYYLAESGFRYAKTEYNNTGDDDGDGEIKDDRNQKLKDWHSPDPPGGPVLFTFSDSKEKFELKIYPYYLVTSVSHVKGVTSLQTEYAGEKPASFTVPSFGKLKIGTDSPYTYTYNSITGVFTISSGLVSNLSDNMDVYLVTSPSFDGSIITKNGDLTIADASFFPDQKGTFRLDGADYVYAYRSKSGNTLQDIYDVDDPDRSFSVTVNTTDDIILNPFLELHSIGIVDHGSSTETKREIVYSVPLATNIEKKSEFVDRFEDKSKWEDSSLGLHEVQTIDGDKALKVTGTSAVGSGDKGSLIALKWSETSVDLGVAHRLGNKYFLSYDSQVKVGFTPLPIPNYYMAGITFRLDSLESDANYYGLSFLSGDNNSVVPGGDGIPNDIVPQNNKTTLVLWQKTNLGSDMTWLAYKDLSQRDFSDDVESGANGWTTGGVPSPDGLWHISSRKPYSGSNSWYYGKESTGTYNTGAANSGSLESPDINLCGFSNAKLSFWSWYKTEPQDQYVNKYDLKFIYILDQNGTTLKYYQIICPGPDKPALASPIDKLEQGMDDPWSQLEIDLSPYVGQIIKVRFYFNTGDAVLNDNEGWYIDDVTISGAFEFPVNEATLLVRVIESASITFNSGGATPIEDGDNIKGSVSGASGTVSGTPIIESGSWTGNDAAGTILLKNVNGTFQNEPLIVIGSITSATVTDFIDGANYIRAYYGDTGACGIPDGDLLDDQRDGNPRGGDIHWPPDEVEDWSADNDYFTFVQWDKVNKFDPLLNPSGVSTIEKINSLDEPDAIIQSNENELLTPTSGIFDQPEIGLHTFGTSSTKVYFDDYALQTESISTEGFLPATQQ